jgi:hypothetical protein
MARSFNACGGTVGRRRGYKVPTERDLVSARSFAENREIKTDMVFRKHGIERGIRGLRDGLVDKVKKRRENLRGHRGHNELVAKLVEASRERAGRCGRRLTSGTRNSVSTGTKLGLSVAQVRRKRQRGCVDRRPDHRSLACSYMPRSNPAVRRAQGRCNEASIACADSEPH